MRAQWNTPKWCGKKNATHGSRKLGKRATQATKQEQDMTEDGTDGQPEQMRFAIKSGNSKVERCTIRRMTEIIVSA